MSTKADPRPAKRIKDKDVFAEFYAFSQECLCCGYYRVEAHHLLSRGQGGDDVLANLVPLCSSCHGVLHSGHPRRGDFGQFVTPTIVRDRIGSWLLSEAGDDARWYLTGKLGLEGSRAWMERQFGVDPL